MRNLSKYESSLAVGILATVYLAGAGLAVKAASVFPTALQEYQAASLTTSTLAAVSVVKVVRTPAPAPVYEKVANQLKARFPTIQLTKEAKGLRVVATSTSDWSDWNAALQAVKTSTPRTSWTATSLCVGPECTGGGLQATLTATQTTVELKN